MTKCCRPARSLRRGKAFTLRRKVRLREARCENLSGPIGSSRRKRWCCSTPEPVTSMPRRGSARCRVKTMATRRLYYDDSFAREFSADVLSCEPTTYQSAAAWEVVLDATA